MPDRRRHRSAAPQDRELFAPERLAVLREAAADLVWLLNRDYPSRASLKLVGDRHELRARQRESLARTVCSDADRERRAGSRLSRSELKDERLAIDGFNVLTTVESAFGGGLVLPARDGTLRDLASLHGTWRRVEETPRALEAIAAHLAPLGLDEVRWYLDAPVSNSGRLAALVREVGEACGAGWSVEVVKDADAALVDDGGVAASADRRVIDGCGRWYSLAREVAGGIEGAWIVDLFTA